MTTPDKQTGRHNINNINQSRSFIQLEKKEGENEPVGLSICEVPR